jgi:hypothetical protein
MLRCMISGFALLWLLGAAFVATAVARAEQGGPDAPAGAGGLSPSYLRCEYRTDPLGVDVKAPRLSWIVESS